MLYSLYRDYAGAATSNAIDIRDDDTIVAVVLDMSMNAATDNQSLYAELGFVATSQFFTNDASSVLVGGRIDQRFVTSGFSIPNKVLCFQTQIDVFSGDRLYLNVSGTAGAAGFVRAFLHTGKPRKSVARR